MSPPYDLSHALRDALVFLQKLLIQCVGRTVEISWKGATPLVIASDGQQDTLASLAVLMVDPVTGFRSGVVAEVTQALFDAWDRLRGGDQQQDAVGVEQRIAQVEV